MKKIKREGKHERKDKKGKQESVLLVFVFVSRLPALLVAKLSPQMPQNPGFFVLSFFLSFCICLAGVVVLPQHQTKP